MADEFDCCECGRHIIALPYDISKMHLCSACLMMPGWWKIPGVARAIDPEHDRTVKDEVD